MRLASIGINVQSSLAFHLQVSFTIETAFIGAGRSILQRIFRTFLHAEVDALAVIDVNRCTCGVGQSKTIQLYGCLIGTRHVELAIGRSA